MKRSVFFSYDHENAAIVRRFAQQVSLSGVELWIDEKKLGPGDHYTTRIFDGIYQADAYVIFISRQSVQSAWVGAELDFAMKRKIEGGRLQIIPVRLDDAEMPVVLSGLEYLDARAGVEDTAARLSARLGAGQENAEGRLAVVSVGFAMTDRTDVEIGPFNEEVSAADLAENRERLLQSMRKSAYGILMNFVSIEDFDFGSEVPWFKNGIYTEDVRKVAGSTAGSLREQVCIETTVFHPSEEKLDRLLRDRRDHEHGGEKSVPQNSGAVCHPVLRHGGRGKDRAVPGLLPFAAHHRRCDPAEAERQIRLPVCQAHEGVFGGGVSAAAAGVTDLPRQ